MTAHDSKYILDKVEEMHVIEELFAKGMSRRAVRRELTRRGWDDRTADRRIELVFKRWVDESKVVTRDEQRALISEALWSVAETAMKRKKWYVCSTGDFSQELVEKPDPDLKSAAVALDTLGRIHGIYEQPNAGGVLGGELIAKFQEFFGLGAVAGALAANTQQREPEPEIEGVVVEPKRG